MDFIISENVVICAEKIKIDLNFASTYTVRPKSNKFNETSRVFRLYNSQDNLHILWYGLWYIRSECKNINVDLRKSTNEF